MKRTAWMTLVMCLALPGVARADAGADAADDAADAADEASAAADSAAADAGDDGCAGVPVGIQPTTTPDNLGCAMAPTKADARAAGAFVAAAVLWSLTRAARRRAPKERS